MFPLYDINKGRKPHPVTIALIVINLVLLAYELHLNSSHSLTAFLNKYGMVSARFLESPNRYELFTLVSSTFLHAGLFHCLSNMWFLWIFGDNVEDHLGSISFLFFYLFCGFSAEIIYLAADPSATVPAIGASGAIAGVLGAYIVLHPEAKVVTTHPIFGWFKPITIPAYWFLGIWFALQLISGWASFLAPSLAGGVAWWAHIGGFLGGALFASFMPRIEAAKHDRNTIAEYSFGHQAFTILFLSLIVSTILTWQIQLHNFRPKHGLPAFKISSTAIDPDLSKLFKQQRGWSGTNRAFSVSLNKKQSLWLFGHSWINIPLAHAKKSTSTLIDNAAAWQGLGKPAIPVQFFWSSNNKKPSALLKALKIDRRYEPVSSILIGDRLYLFARHRPIGNPYELESIDLLCVANPQAKPTSWKIRQITLPEGVQQLRLGSACVLQNNYLYVYGALPTTESNYSLVLARLPIADLSNSAPNWQYCGKQSRDNKNRIWTDDYHQAMALASDLPEEMTISKINQTFGFVATYLKPQSCEIMLRQATNPEGPWSAPLKAFDCGNNTNHLIPYEAVNHPELANQPGELVVSYFSDDRPQQSRQIPHFVRIVLSESPKAQTEFCRLSSFFEGIAGNFPIRRCILSKDHSVK